jgi:nucleotide-binding universal stress UspA family protein
MAKRILVSLDHSPTAASVVPVVADLARGSHATVRLLHVAPQPDNQVDRNGRVIAYADREMASLEAEALDYLRTLPSETSRWRASCGSAMR